MSIEQFIADYESGMSIVQMAEKYKTYPNKIRRQLIKAGYTMRSRGEAQKIALSSGRANHPTRGKKHSKETLAKISDVVAESWKNMTPKEAEKRSKKMSKLWKARPKEQQIEMNQKAAKAVARAGKEGSKTELFIGDSLRNLGHDVIIHKKSLISNENLELDIFLPSSKTVIEVDGPSHFLPIWGEEALKKRIALDNEKNGLLLSEGYSIIRIKCIAKNMTDRKRRLTFEKLLACLEENKNNQNYYKEIEVE